MLARTANAVSYHIIDETASLTRDGGTAAKRIAAAERLGRSAGDTVNSVWNESGVRTGGLLGGWWYPRAVADDEEGEIEEIAEEEHVNVRACVISCFSLAYVDSKHSERMN